MTPGAWLALAAVAAAFLLWRRLRGQLERRARRSRLPEQSLRLELQLPEGEAETLVDAIDAALASLPDAVREPSDVLGDRLHVHLYGADAHTLLRVLRPLLAEAPLGPGSRAVLRAGSPARPFEQVLELAGPGATIRSD